MLANDWLQAHSDPYFFQLIPKVYTDRFLRIKDILCQTKFVHQKKPLMVRNVFWRIKFLSWNESFIKFARNMSMCWELLTVTVNTQKKWRYFFIEERAKKGLRFLYTMNLGVEISIFEKGAEKWQIFIGLNDFSV